MNLCSDSHDEVCFDGRNCPLCQMVKEKDAEIENLNDTIKVKDGEIKALQQEVENLETAHLPTFVQKINERIAENDKPQ